MKKRDPEARVIIHIECEIVHTLVNSSNRCISWKVVSVRFTLPCGLLSSSQWLQLIRADDVTAPSYSTVFMAQMCSPHRQEVNTNLHLLPRENWSGCIEWQKKFCLHWLKRLKFCFGVLLRHGEADVQSESSWWTSCYSQQQNTKKVWHIHLLQERRAAPHTGARKVTPMNFISGTLYCDITIHWKPLPTIDNL